MIYGSIQIVQEPWCEKKQEPPKQLQCAVLWATGWTWYTTSCQRSQLASWAWRHSHPAATPSAWRHWPSCLPEPCTCRITLSATHPASPAAGMSDDFEIHLMTMFDINHCEIVLVYYQSWDFFLGNHGLDLGCQWMINHSNFSDTSWTGHITNSIGHCRDSFLRRLNHHQDCFVVHQVPWDTPSHSSMLV